MSYESRQRTLQNAAGATGDGITIDVTGYSTAVLQVSGTFTGTVTFEATVDDTNWVAIEAVDVGDSTSKSTTATAAGLWRIDVSGISKLRARVSAYTSGSITVKAMAVGV